MGKNPANPHKYWVFRWPLSDTKVGKVGKKWPFLQNFHQKLADTQDDFPKFFSKVGKISCGYESGHQNIHNLNKRKEAV